MRGVALSPAADAASGGAAMTPTELLTKAVYVLAGLEWRGEHGCCPVCKACPACAKEHNEPFNGHVAGCGLKEVLAVWEEMKSR